MTSEGTRIAGKMLRMSASEFILVSATAAAGLAAVRRYAAHQSRKCGSEAMDGARESKPTGPPQFSRMSSRNSSRSAAVGPHGYDLSRILFEYVPIMASAAVRSG